MKNSSTASISTALLIVFAGCSVLSAEDGFDAAAEVLQHECIACHGRELQMGGLRLDSREAAMSVIEPRNSKESLLVLRLTDTSLGLTMPPTFDSEELPPKHRETLSNWIDQGAHWPKGRSLERAPVEAKHLERIKSIRQQIRQAKLDVALQAIDSQAELINARDESGSTLLHAAALYGDADFVGELIGRGADVNAQDHDEITPLMLAIQDAEKTKLLLDAGADRSKISWKDRSALTLAASSSGNAEVVELLLTPAAKLPVSHIHQSLHQAMRVLDLDMVKLLVEKGGEFQVETFLYVGRATELDFLQAVIELTGEKQRQAALDMALAGAAQEGSRDVVAWLLEQGADPSPALVQAAYSEYTNAAFVQRFLDAGAEPGYEARLIRYTRTPLEMAIYHADPEVVKLLLEAKQRSNSQRKR